MLKVKEDSLRAYARYMVTDSFTHSRMIADSFYPHPRPGPAVRIRLLPFPDSQRHFQTLCPGQQFPHFHLEPGLQEGPYFAGRKALSDANRDGSLKLFPLYDVGDDTAERRLGRSSFATGSARYTTTSSPPNTKEKILPLFGIDDNSFTSNRKWMEVLTFNQKVRASLWQQTFLLVRKRQHPQQPRYRVSLSSENARVLANYIS